MADFLLELLSEEIPARMQSRARNDLARMFAEEMDRSGLTTGAIDVHSTPRRLVLIARGVAAETQAAREEIKGPKASAPAKAIEGFLRKTGLNRDQLEERDGILFAAIDRPGRPAAAVIGDALGQIVAGFPWPKSMRWGGGSTRWVRPIHGIVAMLGDQIVPFDIEGIASGATTVGHRFHHPGAITIGGAGDYAEKLRACHVIVDQDERERLIREGAEKAADEAGLKLIADEGLVVENAGLTEWPVPLLGRFDADFLDVPREVIVLTMRTNQKYFACAVPPPQGEVARSAGGGAKGERKSPLRQPAADTSPEGGGIPPPPSAVPLPQQAGGGLAPAFLCIANLDASDGGAAIVEGNRRVLTARLADARFFWEQDLRVPLEEQARKLGGIVFHEKLGTVADKVERVAKLARWLVEEHIVTSPLPPAGGAGGGPVKSAPDDMPSPNPSREREGDLAALAERAARLAKADLVTGMVGEFPELQGVIGGHLARAQGEPAAIADAIRDHYKPIGQGDEVPTAPVTVAVSLADKLDTLAGFFGIDERPTGSKDPFALRRAALAVIRLQVENGLRMSFHEAFQLALQPFEPDGDKALLMYGLAANHFEDFFADRLKVQQREAGVRHDLIDAVFALGGEDDLVRLLARVKALQLFVETGDGADLLTAYKRAANILKREKWSAPEIMSSADEQGIPQTGEEDPLSEVEEPIIAEAVAELAQGAPPPSGEPHEAALAAALDSAEATASAAIEAEDFTGAMAALASLRTAIDEFFDHVTVNDPDAATRERRLNLLLRFRDAVHRVADFSRIEG